MNNARAQLIDFAENARGLDDTARLKLILLATGVKPATFFALKISPSNLDEKAHLEKHLRACKLFFSAGKPRGYEEITGITGNAVQWKLRGTWYGYDVFKDKKHQHLFARYVMLVKRQQHEQADRSAGKIYAYPSCCTEHYIQEHKLSFLRSKYTHYSYYKHIHDVERAFPLVQHTACSIRCSASKKINAHYAAAVKKHAPEFLKRFSATRKHKTDVVVDADSELTQDMVAGISSTAPVFPEKDGHAYTLITLKPVEHHYYLLNHLTKKTIPRGTVLPAKITMRYSYADVQLGNSKRVIKSLHHERHFALP
jgi:hypothetical protein